MEQVELLLWFEDTEEITDHLWRMAYSFAASSTFDEMPPEEKGAWLFKQVQLVNYFQQMRE